METVEYRTVDKSNWPRGEWDDEADKRQWPDEATGLACLIVRGPSGALCGYVGVAPEHPWHGRDYSELEMDIDVHGGLTFSDSCGHHNDPAHGVCHVPAVGEPDDVWWFGFDCAHLYDRSGMAWKGLIGIARCSVGDTYRDQGYVERQCAKPARQVEEAG